MMLYSSCAHNFNHWLLKQNEQRYLQFFRENFEAIAVVDWQGVVREVNQSFAMLFSAQKVGFGRPLSFFLFGDGYWTDPRDATVLSSDYIQVHGLSILNRYRSLPSQRPVIPSTKVPTVLCYDHSGSACAIGIETETEKSSRHVEDGTWIRVDR